MRLISGLALALIAFVGLLFLSQNTRAVGAGKANLPCCECCLDCGICANDGCANCPKCEDCCDAAASKTASCCTENVGCPACVIDCADCCDNCPVCAIDCASCCGDCCGQK